MGFGQMRRGRVGLFCRIGEDFGQGGVVMGDFHQVADCAFVVHEGDHLMDHLAGFGSDDMCAYDFSAIGSA